MDDGTKKSKSDIFENTDELEKQQLSNKHTNTGSKRSYMRTLIIKKNLIYLMIFNGNI